MKKKIIIVGPAASGKDVLRKRFEKRGYKYGKPYTTRPVRMTENDDDYNFINIDDFEKMEKLNMFATYCSYNGWHYGITNDVLENCDVFVMTPEYIKDLKRSFVDECFIIYINPDEETRRKRLTERNDADTVARRLEADKSQFSDFTRYDLMITNPEF